MINIAIDTNAISKLKVSNASYKAIKRLVENEHLIVHIPYVVKREFETQAIHGITAEYNKATASLKTLSNKVSRVSKIKKIFDELLSINEVITDNVKESTQYFFDGWGSIIHDIDHTQAINSLESYFQGTLPFRNPKDKNDIPDSFVCRGIESLKNNGNIDYLVVITNDNQVFNNFSGKNGYHLYRNIYDFLNIEPVQNSLKTLDLLLKTEKYRKNPLDLIEKIECNTPILGDYLKRNSGEFLYGKTISHASIPDDNDEAVINSFDDAEKVSIQFTDPIHYGEDQIGLYFELTIWVNAHFYIHKPDYYIRNYNFTVADHNEYYFEGEDAFHLRVTGIVSVKIDFENFDIDDFELSKNYDLPDNQEIEDLLHDMYVESTMNIESIESIEVIR